MIFNLTPWTTAQILENIHIGDTVRFNISGKEDRPEKIKLLENGNINKWLINGGGQVRLISCPHKKAYVPFNQKPMPNKYISVVKMEKLLGKEKTEKILKSLQKRDGRSTLFIAEPLSLQERAIVGKCLKAKNWRQMSKVLKCAPGSEFHAFAKLAFRYLKFAPMGL